jgi:hypothetical protein
MTEKIYPSLDNLVKKVIDSEGEMYNSIFQYKFKLEKIENNFQNFRKEILNDRKIFISYTIFLFFIYIFFIYKSYPDLTMVLIYSSFAFFDILVFIFSLVYYKKNFSLIYEISKKRLCVFLLFNLIGLIFLIKNTDFLFFISNLHIFILLQNLLFFFFFEKYKYLFLIGIITIICIIFFAFIWGSELICGKKNIEVDFAINCLIFEFFYIMIGYKINKFLRFIFFENYKLKKLLIYKSHQLEGFNFLEFAWFNKEKNHINKNLKEFLYNYKNLLIKGKEDMYSSSANNSSISNSNNEHNFLEVLSGKFFFALFSIIVLFFLFS